MNQAMTLEAEKREVTGKAVKKFRREGKSPAVLYGLGQDSVSLFVDTKDFLKLYHEAGLSTLLDVKINDEAPIKALIGEVQVHPVTSRINHVDLKRVDMKKTITAEVRLSFVGESLAVKGLGGSLTTQIDSVEVECLPTDLISEIEVDVSVLETFEDAIHVKDLKVPSTITVLADPEHTVATVQPPRSEEELAALDEAVVEDVSGVEVEEKGKEEEGEEGEKEEGDAEEKTEDKEEGEKDENKKE